jgi:hypothetical protein
MFIHLSRSLELFNLELTESLKNYYKTKRSLNIDTDELQSFLFCGLVSIFFGSGAINGSGDGFRANTVGDLFVRYI